MKRIVFRLKELWINFFCRVLYCFKPVSVIFSCIGFMFLTDVVCIMLLFQTSEGMPSDILIAILTGVTASALVAIILEMVNNYQRNNKRWLRLSRLFSSLAHYELEVQIATGEFDSSGSWLDLVKSLHDEKEETPEEVQRSIRKTKEIVELEAELDGELKRDRVCCVFDKLPELISLVEDAYTGHGGDFHRHELESMYSILSGYRQIISEVSLVLLELSSLRPEKNSPKWEGLMKWLPRRLRSSLPFGKASPKRDDLIAWLPKYLRNSLDELSLMELAEASWEEYRQRVAETLVRQGALALEGVGIKLADDMIFCDEEEEDTQEYEIEDLYNCAYSKIISNQVHEIDLELSRLQKIIQGEPGFRTIYAYNKKSILKYGNPSHISK